MMGKESKVLLAKLFQSGERCSCGVTKVEEKQEKDYHVDNRRD
jgi:hypothetical protein